MTLSAHFRSQAIGDHLHTAARSVVPFIALAYVAGFMVGTFIHNLNRSLSSLVSPAPLPSLAPSSAPIAALPPVSAPILAIAPQSAPVARDYWGRPLECLTVKELRIIARQAGHRALARSGRRADLLAVLS